MGELAERVERLEQLRDGVENIVADVMSRSQEWRPNVHLMSLWLSTLLEQTADPEESAKGKNVKTLTDRIKEDNIRIVWGEDDEISEIIREETTSDLRPYYVWRIVLASDVNGSTIEVEFGNNVISGTNKPNVDEVFWGLLSNASGIVSADTFPEWVRENYGIDPDYARSEDRIYDFVDKAWAVYQENVTKTAELRTFLGDKFDAYLYKTQFDV